MSNQQNYNSQQHSGGPQGNSPYNQGYAAYSEQPYQSSAPTTQGYASNAAPSYHAPPTQTQSHYTPPLHPPPHATQSTSTSAHDPSAALLPQGQERSEQVETLQSYEARAKRTEDDVNREILQREFPSIDGSLIAAIYGDSGSLSATREMLQVLGEGS